MSMERPGRYIKGTIEGQVGWRGYLSGQKAPGRSMEEYMADLGMTAEDIDGKDILDLGSSATARFEHEVGERANVISLSPDYAAEEHRERLPAETKAVAGIGQQLPFKNESFDQILAYHLTEHITAQELEEVLIEAARVLREGGQMRLMPIWPGGAQEAVIRAFAVEHELNLEMVPSGKVVTERVEGSRNQYYKIELLRATLTK